MRNSDWHGILGSLALHALLVVAFMYMEPQQDATQEIGYIQVEFGDFSEGQPVMKAPETRPEPVQPELEPEVEEEPQPADPEEAKPVDLPDVEPIEDPPISSPETDIEAIQTQEVEEEQVNEEEPETPRVVRPLGSGNAEGRTASDEGSQGEGQDEQKAAPYQIEGLDRNLVQERLPSYDSQVNADIKVRIWVSPKGRIDRQVFLLKADPRLEEAVRIALRSWRFDPLPHNVPQEAQIGDVTFRFRLE